MKTLFLKKIADLSIYYIWKIACIVHSTLLNVCECKNNFPLVYWTKTLKKNSLTLNGKCIQYF